MTRDELIEKVARSICKFTYGDRNDDVWHTFTDEAIAAINTIYEALKEPTPQMISDGDDIINYMILKSESIYKAMLNASPLNKGE